MNIVGMKMLLKVLIKRLNCFFKKKNIKIIYSTRAGSGRVLRRESMVREGIISADNLNPQKARVLAMLALTISKDPEKIQHIFDTH